MDNRFLSRWTEKEEAPSLMSKIKNAGKPSVNLKQQITLAAQRLDAQTRMLDSAVKHFEVRDAELFQRIAKALVDRDQARANILATELSEIRKVEKMLTHASLGLQSISMRLSTVSEMGDLVAVLGPAKSVLSSIGSEMCSIMPEASQELGNIGNLLSEIVTTTNQNSDMPVNTPTANEDALSILEEAEVAAENTLKQRLPEAASQTFSAKKSRVEV